MSTATYSDETTIREGLFELRCAEHNFAEISGVVSRQRLAQGLSGSKSFDTTDAKKMLDVLTEMRELARLSPTPPDWKRTAEIRKALKDRRTGMSCVAEIANELGAVYA